MKTKSEFMVWMRILIGLFILSFMYFVVADRRAPFTTEGRVHGQVVQIAPEITSRVVGVNVRNNEHVHKGQILFKLDNQRFVIALCRRWPVLFLALPKSSSGLVLRVFIQDWHG